MSISTRLTDKDVKKYVSAIINQMARASFRPDIVIGLARGGIVPALLVSHYFDCECYIRNKEETLFEKDFFQRNILVIDDINDSGNTLTAVNHELYQELELREIKYATLINNESSAFTVDFSGADFNRFEQNDWFVFPWEDWWSS